jgi:hypothetical protein
MYICILDFPVPVAAEEYYFRFLLGTGFRFDALAGKNGALAYFCFFESLRQANIFTTTVNNKLASYQAKSNNG